MRHNGKTSTPLLRVVFYSFPVNSPIRLARQKKRENMLLSYVCRRRRHESRYICSRVFLLLIFACESCGVHACVRERERKAECRSKASNKFLRFERGLCLNLMTVLFIRRRILLLRSFVDLAIAQSQFVIEKKKRSFQREIEPQHKFFFSLSIALRGLHSSFEVGRLRMKKSL